MKKEVKFICDKCKKEVTGRVWEVLRHNGMKKWCTKCIGLGKEK